MIGQQKIYSHKHISGILNETSEKVGQDLSKFRFIIFIYDLDRCAPERALEIIESIKTFFGIEGIIYIIGMVPLIRVLDFV
jgi:predicted KAP-like P-loop ATPase